MDTDSALPSFRKEEVHDAQVTRRRKCGECKKNPSIYQCPGCNLRTCSLDCCRGHKQRTGCTGKRNRGAFLPVCQMTDGDVRSDYFFLEEVLDQMPRNRKRSRVDATPPKCLSKKARRLVQQAERRGTTVQIMPPMMERHKSNNSWYCAPRDQITWKVEVIVYPDEQKISFQLSENEEHIMDHVSSQCEKRKIPLMGSYLFFLKRLPASAHRPRFIRLEPSDTMKKVLHGRTVIEHPTVYCVPEDQADEFPTGSDKVLEMETTTKDD